jgi:hypothetical protein
MASDAAGPDAVDRPDFKKRSVIFGVVEGLAVGAVVGTAIFAGGSAIGQLFKEKALRLPFKELLKKEADTIGITAAAAGGTSFGMTLSRNNTIDETLPYVEKLEQQRDNLIAQAGNAR